MKTLLIIMLLGTMGCATAKMSEYNRGCNDGANETLHRLGIQGHVTDKFCEDVEAANKPQKDVEKK